jgi:lipocalin-like protein
MFPLIKGETMKNLEAETAHLAGASIEKNLVGTWALKRYTNIDSHANAVEPFGNSPVGILIYTPDGLVSAQLMDPDRRWSHQEDWGDWTPEEYAVFARGYTSYCGRYEVDEIQSTVTHVPSVAFLPNLVNQRLLRRVEMIGNGVPGKFCTSGGETNWYGRSLEWHEESGIVLSRS